MQPAQSQSAKSGYYTVQIVADNGKIPYTIFADSDYHAARLVKDETGYAATEDDVEGPFHRAVKAVFGRDLQLHG